MSGAAAALASHRNRRLWRLIESFRRHGALAPTTSRTLEEMGIADRSWVSTLTNAGVIVQSSPGRWHLDEPALAAWQAHRRRRAGIILIGVAMLVLAFLGLSLR